MERLISKPSKLDTVLFIFIAVLLLSFHFFFIYFVNSTYITAYVGDKMLGIIYGMGAILNISLFLLVPKILRKTGVIKLTLILTFIEAFSLILLAFPLHPMVAISSFLLHMTVASAIIYCMDMILEHYSNPAEIGTMRGMFLTMWNIPPIITPFIAGIILANSNTITAGLGDNAVIALHNAGFWKIYIISAVFLIPFLVIIRNNFKTFKDPVYSTMNITDTFKSFYKNSNVFDVFADRLLLNLYFAWNVVYLPIFLHQYIGFSWGEIGIILSTMLLPFVLFQRVIGKIQDQKHQEKILLICGFLVMAIGTGLQPFLTTHNIFAWITLLFLTHVGAAFVEVSTESYFFRHVKPENASYISLFRMTRTLPYIIMPPIVVASLFLFPFKYMFLVLGAIMLLGIRYAFLIKEA